MVDTAVYMRRSKSEQDVGHQRDSVENWLDDNGLQFSDVDIHADVGSGADADRDQFQQLVEAIEDGEYQDIVVWEISRIARKGFLAQRFFDAAEEGGATIHVTNGSVRRVEPDGHGRMVADVIAAVAAEERRNLIRRTEASLKRAKNEGKWLGQVPVGFVRVEGYLRPNLSPDHDRGEAGYLDVVDAIERLDQGESYRSVASETPNVSRQTLMRIDKDDDRRAWYMEGEADDERVSEALAGMDE